MSELEADGSVEWIGEPPAELRPREVEEFLMFTDKEFGLVDDGFLSASGEAACPHCRVTLKFDDGPHVDDARLRPGSRAWTCPGCGSGGLAFVGP